MRAFPLLFVTAVACTSTGADKPGDDTADTDTDTGTGDTDTADTADSDTLAPGLVFLDTPTPIDLTPDGRTALLWDNSVLEGEAWLYDVARGELVFATTVGDVLRDFPTGLSANREISALHGDPVQAGVWSPETGWKDVPSPYAEGCGADVAGGWDISADGSVVVGLLWNGCAAEAFRWDAASGSDVLTPLEVVGSPESGSRTNRATAVSDDGAVAAGFAQHGVVDRWPALWGEDGAGMLLPAGGFPEDAPGEILSVSADGTVVAGTWNTDAFYWSEADGVVNIGKLPDALGNDTTYANAIAADGDLIFGACGDPFFSIPRAFVWTEAAGMRVLADILAANGVAVPEGYVLTNVLGASLDGAVLVGSALDADYVQRSFVAVLPDGAYGL